MLAQLNPPIKALILDMDGVLWAGNEALIDMPAAFQKMKDLDLKVVLATNNATQTAAQFVEKVRSFGVELEPEQIINSPMAVADILEQRFPGGGPVYVFGEEGIRTTLKEHGYYHAEKNVLAVVVGLNRQATFADFCAATSLIRGGAPFIATNPDKTFPQSNGTVIPGGGAFVAFFEASTDVTPTIAGKPFPFLFNLALKRLSIAPRQTLAVGDRLETDVVGARDAGCRTGLVLSGVSNLKDLETFSPRPDLVAKDLLAMLTADVLKF
jgi:4-nitrophenyl phosphatase